MKKILITMAVITTMVAGAMMFSSFAAPKQDVRCETSKIVLIDNGWEDFTSGIRAYAYYKKNGQWENVHTDFGGCKVQRREWCGTPEYRISYNNGQDWYAVSSSPVDDYTYCFYYNGYAYCFNM